MSGVHKRTTLKYSEKRKTCITPILSLRLNAVTRYTPLDKRGMKEYAKKAEEKRKVLKLK